MPVREGAVSPPVPGTEAEPGQRRQRDRCQVPSPRSPEYPAYAIKNDPGCVKYEESQVEFLIHSAKPVSLLKARVLHDYIRYLLSLTSLFFNAGAQRDAETKQRCTKTLFKKFSASLRLRVENLGRASECGVRQTCRKRRIGPQFCRRSTF